jgi:hypothetical protein
MSAITLTPRAVSALAILCGSADQAMKLGALAERCEVTVRSMKGVVRAPMKAGLVGMVEDVVGLTGAGLIYCLDAGMMPDLLSSTDVEPVKPSGAVYKLDTAAANLPKHTISLAFSDLAHPGMRKPELDLLVSVPCPYCGAGIGSRCRSPKTGNLRNRNAPHAQRRDKALASSAITEYDF